MRRRPWSLVSAGGALVLLSSILAGRTPAAVIVVDAAGGGAYTSIQPAVDAAVDGDILFVRAGTYAGFSIVDKSLVVSIDPPVGFDQVKVDGVTEVRSLSPGKTVQLSFLTGKSLPYAPTSHALVVDNCQGHVRVQACRFTGIPGSSSSNGADGTAGARVINSADVLFVGCQLFGGYAANVPPCDGTGGTAFGGRGGDGLHATGSSVVVYDSLVRGGKGGEGCFVGGFGGDGGRLETTTLFTSNTKWEGGGGQWAIEYIGCGFVGGDGGDGLHVDAGSTARVLDCDLIAGAPGPPALCNVAGNPGQTFAGAGTVTLLGGVARAFNTAKSAHEGQSILLQFAGIAGDTAFLFLSTSTGAQAIDPWSGVFLLGSPLIGPLLAGVVPAGGYFEFNVTVPQLPTGLLGAGVYEQAIFVDAVGNVRIGSPGYLTIFDASL